MSVTISFTEPKVPLAAEVFVRINGRDLTLGGFTTSQFPTYSTFDDTGVGNRRTYRFQTWFKGDDSDTVDIVFRPKPELAVDTPDLTQIYGGEFVHEKVPVTRTEPYSPR